MKNLKEFWQKNETKIVLVVGFILAAAISFEGGYLHGKTQKESPIILEKSSPDVKNEDKGIVLPESDKTADNQQKEPQGDSNFNQTNCAFIGSKNSNKYHLPTCRFAKNIKAENLVCFKSVEDAAQKSYQPDKTCIK